MTGGGALPFVLLAISGQERHTPDRAVRSAADAAGSDVAVLLRDRSLAPGELRRWAERVVPLCRAAGTHLLVHGDPAIAREVGADGVHLPDNRISPESARALLGPGLVGVSRHDGARLQSAKGADYATLGPVWPTPGKGQAIGVERFRQLCRDAALPVVALGGVVPERARACRGAGAAGIAAIRAVWTADPAESVRRFLEEWAAG